MGRIYDFLPDIPEKSFIWRDFFYLQLVCGPKETFIFRFLTEFFLIEADIQFNRINVTFTYMSLQLAGSAQRSILSFPAYENKAFVIRCRLSVDYCLDAYLLVGQLRYIYRTV